MTRSLASFYRGKTVLVTGHTGFKGSWLSVMLKSLGARVVGFALAPPAGEPSMYRDAGVGRGMTSITGDVRDAAALAAAVRAFEPQVVLHLAAQPLVRGGYRDPVGTYATNVMGTVHVLEAVRRAPSVRSVVVVTTDKVYEPDPRGLPFREADRLGGPCPYSSSKAAAEMVASAYRASYFSGGRGSPGLATARAGNVIGGGDWAGERVVPDLVRAVAAKKPLVLRNPGAVRPWQHVLEPLRGYLMLAARLATDGAGSAGAWNFGPRDEDAVPVGELAERFAASWGGDAVRVVVRPDPQGGHETPVLRLDRRKSRARLGWDPLLSLDEAVGLTVDWYRAWLHDPADAETATEEQVAAYLARAAAAPPARVVRPGGLFRAPADQPDEPLPVTGEA
jgi:CDP-glucose 4,6-dehydratase